jgi:hypothetical protein
MNQEDIQGKPPQNPVSFAHLLDNFIKSWTVGFNPFNPLGDMGNFELVLGINFGQVGHILHGDTELSLGTAVEDDNFNGFFLFYLK